MQFVMQLNAENRILHLIFEIANEYYAEIY